MTLRTLLLRPDSDGYGSSDGAEWVRSELDGGVGRYRRDKIGASKMVSCRWTLNPSQYQYWRSFYRLVGGDRFLCDLVGESGLGPIQHECHFMPGSVSLASQQGLTYIQQAQLEVKPIIIPAEFDEAVLVLYATTGGLPDSFLADLAELATITIPDSFSA